MHRESSGERRFPVDRPVQDLLLQSEVVRSLAGLFDCDVKPTGLSKAVFKLLNLTLEGTDYRMQVKSTGLIGLFNTNVVQDLRAFDVNMFMGLSSSLGRVAGTETFGVSWKTTGISAIQSLLTQFLFGYIRATVYIKVTAIGFSKTFSGTVRIPVNKVEWSLGGVST